MAWSLPAAVRRLADVLERENAALLVMDLQRATALLPEKTAAIAALTGFGEAGGEAGGKAAGAMATPSPAAPYLADPNLAAMAQRLDALALANRRLLERAIEAQRRVIGIVARAAVSAAAVGPEYGATGRPAAPTRPMALSTRA